MHTYLWPGTTLVGRGCIEQLGAHVAALGGGHAFLMVDPGVAHLLPALEASLASADVTWTAFDRIAGNPTAADTDAAFTAYAAAGADLIVAVGGGSALDMGKGVRILAGSPAGVSVAEYQSTRGEHRRPNPPRSALPPMIAAPTTAGTGSEVTPWGVVTDTQTQQKAGVGTNLIPDVALCDPDLTVSLPPHLTAATGMDALSHLIEAYVSTNAHPMLDPLIRHGIALVADNLPLAVAEPGNVAARTAMMEAALLGGVALSSNWLGACHSLAHQLSTFAGMHHGLACALMLPPQMAFSRTGAPERYADVAEALCGDRSADPAALVAALNATCGLPARLRDAGVRQEHLTPMSEHAMRDTNWWTNPVRPTQADMTAMYEAAF